MKRVFLIVLMLTYSVIGISALVQANDGIYISTDFVISLDVVTPPTCEEREAALENQVDALEDESEYLNCRLGQIEDDASCVANCYEARIAGGLDNNELDVARMCTWGCVLHAPCREAELPPTRDIRP